MINDCLGSTVAKDLVLFLAGFLDKSFGLPTVFLLIDLNLGLSSHLIDWLISEGGILRLTGVDLVGV